MGHRELTEKDLSVDEKKIFGKIIDMWSVEDSSNPYAHSTESRLKKRAKLDGLSEEIVQKTLSSLEAKSLLRTSSENGEVFIKYNVGAAHIVRELQKTSYVREARDFKPYHH